jgi:hypothetical protein
LILVFCRACLNKGWFPTAFCWQCPQEEVTSIVANTTVINVIPREIRPVVTCFFFSATLPFLYWLTALTIHMAVKDKEKIRMMLANCCISLSSLYTHKGQMQMAKLPDSSPGSPCFCYPLPLIQLSFPDRIVPRGSPYSFVNSTPYCLNIASYCFSNIVHRCSAPCFSCNACKYCLAAATSFVCNSK